MYTSGYPQTNLGLVTMKKHRSKGKSCGYYMNLVFFFSSLIQSLIIVSLVLFLVYGQPQQTEEKRVQELEQSYSKLSLENVALRADKKNLTQRLNFTVTEKKIADRELRKLANNSALIFDKMQAKLSQCDINRRSPVPHSACSPLYCSEVNAGKDLYLRHQLQQTEEILKLVRANFTEKIQIMSLELENAHQATVTHHLAAIELRRDKNFLQERLNMYEKKCKEDFVQFLQGIPDVTKEFLKRVDDLFLKHSSFQLTCEKQNTHLERVRANCSSLSREVENKLQEYLDKVATQVTTTIGENTRLTAENKRLNEDFTWCTRNRSGLIEEHKNVLKQIQLKFDQETEKLLLEVRKTTGEKKLQEDLVSVKGIEIKVLDAKLKDLNASLTACKALPRSQFPGSTSFLAVPQGTGGIGSLGLGSSGQGTSLYGRTVGGSVGSSGLGLGGLQKSGSASSVATGSSSPALSSPGQGLPAWPGIGFQGTGVAGLGSTGSGTAGLGNTGLSSTAFGNNGAGNMGLSKSPGLGGVGSSGLTRTGTGGTGFGYTGSSAASSSTIGGKVTSGSDALLTAQLNQHLQDLRRYAKST